MVVDEIVDVVEEAVTVRQKAVRKGLLGSAVVGKRVTDFLDLNQVIDAAKENWFQGSDEIANGQRILIADSSAFSRGMMRSALDMSGYVVQEAGDLGEAVRCLEHRPADVVLTALDLPPGGSAALLAAMRRRADWEGIPVLAVADSVEEIQKAEWRAQGFQGCQTKFDSSAILESVAKLLSATASAELMLAGAGEKR
jgi:CheY-like chemotaxis protein